MSSAHLHRLSRWLVASFARVMLKLDVHRHGPPLEGQKLLVANHPSCTDPFLISLVDPQPVRLLIVEEAFVVPVFGALLRKLGHIPVTVGEGRPAFDGALRRLQAGDSVALFPEGWISPRLGGYNRPQTGTARLALMTGVPVVPVGIYLPRERNWVVSRMTNGRHTVGYWYLRGPYGMTVGEPMTFEGSVDDRERVREVTASIMRRIIRLAAESEQRVTGQAPLQRRIARRKWVVPSGTG